MSNRKAGEFDEAEASRAWDESPLVDDDDVERSRKEFVHGARWGYEHAQVDVDNKVDKDVYNKLQAADELIERLEEKLSFYGDKANWQHGIAYSQNNLMIESDMYCERGDHLYAGRAAKQALNLIKAYRERKT